MNTGKSTGMKQQINLFNPAFQPQKLRLSAATMAIALGLVAVGVAASAIVAHLNTAELRSQAAAGVTRLDQANARLAAANAEFPPRQKDATLDAQMIEAERQLAALRHISGVVARGELGDTSGFSGYFRALARQSVQGLWLTGVSVAGGGRQIGIRGRSLDPASVPGYLNRLTQEPLMQGKTFSSLQISQPAPVAATGADGQPGAARPTPYVEFSLQSVPEEVRP